VDLLACTDCVLLAPTLPASCLLAKDADLFAGLESNLARASFVVFDVVVVTFAQDFDILAAPLVVIFPSAVLSFCDVDLFPLLRDLVAVIALPFMPRDEDF